MSDAAPSPAGAGDVDVDFAGITPELLARYDRPGPRYTSYPTAPHFSPNFGAAAYEAALARAAARPDAPLSLYVHVPFCEARCTYCGCNIVVAPHRGPEERYLEAVERELEIVASHLGRRRTLSQLPLGRRYADVPDAGAVRAPLRRGRAPASGSRPAPRSRSRSTRA